MCYNRHQRNSCSTCMSHSAYTHHDLSRDCMVAASPSLLGIAPSRNPRPPRIRHTYTSGFSSDLNSSHALNSHSDNLWMCSQLPSSQNHMRMFRLRKSPGQNNRLGNVCSRSSRLPTQNRKHMCHFDIVHVQNSSQQTLVQMRSGPRKSSVTSNQVHPNPDHKDNEPP